MYEVAFQFASDQTGAELLPALVAAFSTCGQVELVYLREMSPGLWEASVSFTPSEDLSGVPLDTLAGYATSDFLAAVGGQVVFSAAQVQASQWQGIVAAIAVPVLLGLLAPVMGKLTQKMGLEEK
ncbi:MAG: hypothetical protein JW753_05315 [Dehalococcoidia bacterium]|nr:hypothetical protein [Dehalococcoidia bacterium]